MYEPLMIQIPVAQLPAVEKYISCIVSPDPVTGKFGMIEFLLNMTGNVSIFIYPGPDPYSRNIRYIRKRLLYTGNHALMILCMSDIKVKIIRIRSCSNELPAFKSPYQDIRHSFQNLIPELSSVHLIQHMEMLDIQNYGVHVRLVLIVIHPGNILIEEITGIKTCQGIPFRRIQDSSVLIQLNDPGAPGFYHFRTSIWLGEKIICPEINALNLCRLFRCHDYNRNIAEHPLRTYPLKEFKTVHDGHKKIQEHKGVFRRSFPQHLVGNTSVFRKVCLIEFSENLL